MALGGRRVAGRACHLDSLVTIYLADGVDGRL